MLSRYFAQAVVSLLLMTGALAEPIFPPASRVGLEPPGAMKPAQLFRGFEDREAVASILMVEIPLPARAEVEKDLSAAALKKQGVTETRRETVKLKSGTGLMIAGTQTVEDRKLRKWILLASTPEGAALVAAQVPDGQSAYTDDMIRKALLSTAFRASVPMDEQLARLPIVLSDLAGLRVFQVRSTAVLLTDGPEDEPQVAKQPVLAISVASGGPQQTAERAHFARTLFTGFTGFKDVRVTGTDMIRIGGQQTSEIQAEAKDEKTDAPIKLVQWVRFGNGAFIRFVGAARADVWAQAFQRFRAVREGVAVR